MEPEYDQRSRAHEARDGVKLGPVRARFLLNGSGGFVSRVSSARPRGGGLGIVRAGAKHLSGKFRSPPCDFIEVAVLGIEAFTGFACAAREGCALSREKGLPIRESPGAVCA